jgi:hypothetical protein
MKKLELGITKLAEPMEIDGATLWPCNVCQGDVASTINTRYAANFTHNHILDLSRFPRTVVLIEYDNEDGNYAP